MINYKIRAAAQRLMKNREGSYAHSLGEWSTAHDYDPVVVEAAVANILNPDSEQIESRDPRAKVGVALRDALQSSPEFEALKRYKWMIGPTVQAVETIADTLRRIVHEEEADQPEDVARAITRAQPEFRQVVQDAVEESEMYQGLLGALGVEESVTASESVQQDAIRLAKKLPREFVSRLGAARKALASSIHPSKCDGQHFAGYEKTHDLDEVLASELARLGSKSRAVRALAASDWWTAGLLREKHGGLSSSKGGTFTIYLDESGSMGGYRHDIVAPIVGAALIIAKSNGLTPALYGFNHGLFDPLTLDRGCHASSQVANWLISLQYNQGGGTSYCAVFDHAYRNVPEGGAVWVIGDGEASNEGSARCLSERLTEKCKVSFLGLVYENRQDSIRRFLPTVHNLSFVCPNEIGHDYSTLVESLATAIQESL